MSAIVWPEGRKFAFSIVDDTDYSTVSNISPIYAVLKDAGIRSTKTVWVRPIRDQFTGQTLQDEEYLTFVKELMLAGFEIGLHGIGSGSFTSAEIKDGYEEFNQLLGMHPKMHINHSRNPDNMYWGNRRFTFPLSSILALSKRRRTLYQGEKENSPYFWGNICKQFIKYQRNHVFNGINTLKYDPQMPTRSKFKDKYSNYWFSSSDGHTLEEFNALINKKNIDQLEREGGCCIVYTHFATGFVDSDGNVNPSFKESMQYLSEKGGWYVPVGTILDHLLAAKKNQEFTSYLYLLRLDLKWVLQRVIKRLYTGH